MRQRRKRILVTGVHRSGTTWVGKVMASAPRTFYLQEPFNVDSPNPHMAIRMKWWFQCLIGDEECAEKKAFQDIFLLKLRYPSVNWMSPKVPIHVARRVRALLYNKLLVSSGTVVMKDPIALLSSPWLERHFNVLPVVMIRHPAAFVSSLQLRNWFFNFGNFLEQPGLIENFFPEERSQIEAIVRIQRQDIISEGAFLWKLLCSAIAKFRREYPHWIFLRHEDLSRKPVEEFQNLFAATGLPYGRKTDAYLKSTIKSNLEHYVLNPTPTSSVVRNSQTNIYVWKQRLSKEEIEKIRSVVQDVASDFYSDDEW